MSDIERDAIKLAEYVKKEIPDYARYGFPPVQKHMGALIMDACMQASMDYDQVEPKVKEIEEIPSLKTTKGVLENITNMQQKGFKNQRKQDCLKELAYFFARNGIDTVEDLRRKYPEIRNQLTSINNIGPKTRDYIGLLAGVPDVVAVDVRLQDFAKKAGIAVGNVADNPKHYERLFEVYIRASKILKIEPAKLDNAIWSRDSGMGSGASFLMDQIENASFIPEEVKTIIGIGAAVVGGIAFIASLFRDKE